MAYRRHQLIHGLLIALLSASSAVHSTPERQFVIFGDSLSDAGMNELNNDTGNNYWAKTPGKIGAPITSVNPHTSRHPLWVNHFGTLVNGNQKSIWPQRLAYRLQIDPATHNNNYAWASAETGDHYLNDLSDQPFPPYIDAECTAPGKTDSKTACVPGVLKQVKLYLNAVHHPATNTVFIIWAGGNDLLNNVAKTMSFLSRKGRQDLSAWARQPFTSSLPEKGKMTLHSVIPDLSHPVINILKARNKLIAAGANPDNIYVINLPDLSKTPAAEHLANGNRRILLAIHAITVSYNNSLAFALTRIPFNHNNLRPSHILSIYTLFNHIKEHPEQYNLTDVNNSCVADNKAPICEGYAFFNDKHPTAIMSVIIAKWVAAQIA